MADLTLDNAQRDAPQQMVLSRIFQLDQVRENDKSNNKDKKILFAYQFAVLNK